MFLKLTSNVCSLCEDTDVCLSEADTEHYVRFIQNELGSDLDWVNSKSFRVCLLCTHSLHLLMEVVTGIEDRNVKSCICCKSSSKLFKQSDLPKDHKANVASFATAYNLRGLNICIHCFYAINFWVKLTSFLESSKQTNKRKSNSTAVSDWKSGTHSPTARKSNVSSRQFKLPQNVNKFPEIKKQVKTIRMLQSKMNRVTLKKFASDKKLAEQVPFVFLTRISETNGSAEPIQISDDSDTEESATPNKLRSKGKASARLSKTTAIMKKKSETLQNLTPVKSILYSTDSDDGNAVVSPTRNFRNRRPKVIISPNNKKSQNKKKNTSKNSGVEARFSINKSALKNTEDVATSSKIKKISTSSVESSDCIESDNNDYSVTSSGSNTGIVIKRISRSNKAAKSTKSQKLASSPLRTIRIQTKKASASTSSDNTDISPSTSTPRSPVTLPPKKNRKKIMDLSDTEYYESMPAGKEKRSTTAIKPPKKNRKRLDKDIEEVIIESSEDIGQENGTSPNRRRTRSGGNKSSGKALLGNSMEEDVEKDPLEIISSGEDSEIDTESTQNNRSSVSNVKGSVTHSEESVKGKSPGRPKKQSKSAKGASKSNLSSAEVDDDVQTPKVTKRTFKRLVYKEDDSEDSSLNETQEDKDEACDTIFEKSPIQDEDKNRELNDLGNNENKNDTTSQPNIDQIVSKYLDQTPGDNISIETQGNNTIDTMPANNKNSVDSDNEVLNSMRAIHGTEESNFDSSLISPPAANDTLELLASISDETTKQGNIENRAAATEDNLMLENQLNLQLTPEAEIDAAAKDTQSTVLMTNSEEDSLHTPLVTEVHENVEDAITKASSEHSIYQDAVGSQESNKAVTVLADISFTSGGECTGEVVKDVIEEALISMALNESKDSLITEDDSDVDKSLTKRKRNTEDSVESADAQTLENDETPRTKRVRFAAEKKILNEDDSVCLEDFEGSEEQPGQKQKQKEALSQEHQEQTETGISAEVVDTEELCSLDI